MMLLATLIGCRGLPQPASAPTTHKLRVGQLLITSDFVLTSEHRLVRELTAEREDVGRTLGLPLTDEPIEVYLFSNTDRYRQFLARYFPTVPSRRAFFVETDTSLAVYAHWSDRVAEDLRHEVAHGYLHAAVPGLPLWLDEGLAEFFEVPRGHNGLNRPHVELLSEMTELEEWQPNIAEARTIVRRGPIAANRLRGSLGVGALFAPVQHGKPWITNQLSCRFAQLRTGGAALGAVGCQSC